MGINAALRSAALACVVCAWAGSALAEQPDMAPAAQTVPQILALPLPEHFGSLGLDQHPNIRFDDDGVPQSKVWTTGEYHYNPTFIAGWGLTSFVRYVSSKSFGDFERFVSGNTFFSPHCYSWEATTPRLSRLTSSLWKSRQQKCAEPKRRGICVTG